MIAVAFYKAPGDWLDRLIRVTTASEYSHCELLDECVLPGRAARAVSASWRDGGVRDRQITFDAGRWDVIPLPWAEPTAICAAARHVGAGYDVLGAVLTQLPILAGPSRKRWFCSELIGWALQIDRPETLSPGALARQLRAINRGFERGLHAA